MVPFPLVSPLSRVDLLSGRLVKRGPRLYSGLARAQGSHSATIISSSLQTIQTVLLRHPRDSLCLLAPYIIYRVTQRDFVTIRNFCLITVFVCHPRDSLHTVALLTLLYSRSFLRDHRTRLTRLRFKIPHKESLSEILPS